MLGVATVTATLGLLLWRHFKPLVRWRIRSLRQRSHVLYAAKAYDEALTAAVTARGLAQEQLGDASEAHRRMLLHLAAVHAAMRQHEEAEAVLDENETLINRTCGDGSLALVPICHARAEVYEALGTPAGMRRAIAALERARDLRRLRLGTAHLDYAFACFNVAGLVVRHASDGLVMNSAQRGELAERAADLAIEAAEVAEAAGFRDQGQELAAAVLASMEKYGSGRQLTGIRECAGAIGTLREWLAANGATLPDEEGENEQEAAEDE